MAKEVAQDFMLALDWEPRDKYTFTPVAKGARRGLNRLHGRPLDYKITSSTFSAERRFLEEVRALFALRHEFLPAEFVSLQLHDIQFNLCELDKYLRTKTGEGKPKRRYRAAVASSSRTSWPAAVSARGSEVPVAMPERT